MKPSTINILPNMEIDGIYGVNNMPPVNLISGDWSPYLPTYEPQRFVYDTNECSQLGAFINPLETYFNWLKATGQIKPEFQSFLESKGYFDSNGSFSFSERFTAILDGTSINGNTPQNAWRCFQRYGVIPRSMLNWTIADAIQFPNQSLMDTTYYNPAVITQEMVDTGSQFLSFLKEIGWGWYGGVGDGTMNIPMSELQTGLQTSPLGIVVSIPFPVSMWNETFVPYTGGKDLSHCVELYKIVTTEYPFEIMDQYNPYLKQLEANYFIPVAIAFFVELL